MFSLARAGLTRRVPGEGAQRLDGDPQIRHVRQEQGARHLFPGSCCQAHASEGNVGIVPGTWQSPLRASTGEDSPTLGRGKPHDTTHLTAQDGQCQALGHKLTSRLRKRPGPQISVMRPDTEPECWVQGRALALCVHGILGKPSTLWPSSSCFCSGDTCLPRLRHD